MVAEVGFNDNNILFHDLLSKPPFPPPSECRGEKTVCFPFLTKSYSKMIILLGMVSTDDYFLTDKSPRGKYSLGMDPIKLIWPTCRRNGIWSKLDKLNLVIAVYYFVIN